MDTTLLRYTEVVEIVGDILRVRAPGDDGSIRFGDLARVEGRDGPASLAQVIGIDRDIVTLQLFAGTRGVSTSASVRFLGHPLQVPYSANVLGRQFRGDGSSRDAGPALDQEPRVAIRVATVNPVGVRWRLA